MSDFEPGPSWLPLPTLPPPLFTGGEFTRLLDPLIGVLTGSDGALASKQEDIAGNTRAGLDATYASTIGVVADIDGTHPPSDGDQTASSLVDAGAGTEAYRQSVLRYLPQPDAPVPEDYTPAPPTPGDYPDKPPPDLIDVIQSVNEIRGRVTALEHGTKSTTPTEPKAPPPAAPPPAPTTAPPGVDHLPTYGEVNDAYLLFLGGPASFQEYLDFWAMRTDWYMGIATSGEADDYRRTGISRR